MSTSYSELETKLLEAIRRRLHDKFVAVEEAGIEPETLGDPDTLARIVVAGIPTHVIDQRTGPFYDTAGLTTWLRCSRQALHQRARSGTLLAPVTADGQTVYPAWQFTSEGVVLSGLADILRVLLAATDPWTAALWLRAPSPDLDGDDAVTWLERGGDPQPVLDAAKADAAGWAA